MKHFITTLFAVIVALATATSANCGLDALDGCEVHSYAVATFEWSGALRADIDLSVSNGSVRLLLAIDQPKIGGRYIELCNNISFSNCSSNIQFMSDKTVHIIFINSNSTAPVAVSGRVTFSHTSSAIWLPIASAVAVLVLLCCLAYTNTATRSGSETDKYPDEPG